MASLVVSGLTVGETVKLYPAAKCEPQLRYGDAMPGTPVETQVANAQGKATFTQPSRIEFYAQRANKQFIKVMSSTTRNPPR